ATPAHAPLARAAPPGGQLLQPFSPCLVRRLAAPAGGAPELAQVGGNRKGGLAPAEFLARAGDLLGPERGAVGLLGAGLGRRAESDGGAAGDQARPVGRQRLLQRRRDRVGIGAVDASRRPAGGFGALHLIGAIGG